MDFIEDNGEAYGITRWNYHTDEEKFSKTFDSINGIIRYPPSGHTPFATYIRTSLGVSSVFSELLGCERKDLITSFDRIQIGIPPEKSIPAAGSNVTSEETQNNMDTRGDVETESVELNETMLGVDDAPIPEDTQPVMARLVPECATEDTTPASNNNTNSSSTTLSKNKRKSIKKTSAIPKWIHSDQDDRSHELQCIQGYVSLTDVGSNSGSFFALRGSHLKHEKILKKISKHLAKNSTKQFEGFGGNWVKLPKEIHDYVINKCGCEPSYARPISAGSMVLWDSRLFHANVSQTLDKDIVSEDVYNFTVTNPSESMKHLSSGPSNRVPRLGSYVCMLPRELVAKAPMNQLGRRQKAFLETRTTNHWPTAMLLFPEAITFRGKVDRNTKYDKNYIDPKLRLGNIIDVINNRGEERYDEIMRNMGFESGNAFSSRLVEMREKKD